MKLSNYSMHNEHKHTGWHINNIMKNNSRGKKHFHQAIATDLSTFLNTRNRDKFDPSKNLFKVINLYIVHRNGKHDVLILPHDPLNSVDKILQKKNMGQQTFIFK